MDIDTRLLLWNHRVYDVVMKAQYILTVVFAMIFILFCIACVVIPVYDFISNVKVIYVR